MEQLLLHETEHLTVKAWAPTLVSADVLLQNRCISFGKKAGLVYNRASNLFLDDSKFFMKSSVAHDIFTSFRRYCRCLSIFC